MERMESMEPISAYYTTAYPEIQPDSGFGSSETTDSQAKTPPAPTYDEELVHKVWRHGCLSSRCEVRLSFLKFTGEE